MMMIHLTKMISETTSTVIVGNFNVGDLITMTMLHVGLTTTDVITVGIPMTTDSNTMILDVLMLIAIVLIMTLSFPYMTMPINRKKHQMFNSEKDEVFERERRPSGRDYRWV